MDQPSCIASPFSRREPGIGDALREAGALLDADGKTTTVVGSTIEISGGNVQVGDGNRQNIGQGRELPEPAPQRLVGGPEHDLAWHRWLGDALSTLLGPLDDCWVLLLRLCWLCGGARGRKGEGRVWRRTIEAGEFVSFDRVALHGAFGRLGSPPAGDERRELNELYADIFRDGTVTYGQRPHSREEILATLRAALDVAHFERGVIEILAQARNLLLSGVVPFARVVAINGERLEHREGVTVAGLVRMAAAAEHEGASASALEARELHALRALWRTVVHCSPKRAETLMCGRLMPELEQLRSIFAAWNEAVGRTEEEAADLFARAIDSRRAVLRSGVES